MTQQVSWLTFFLEYNRSFCIFTYQKHLISVMEVSWLRLAYFFVGKTLKFETLMVYLQYETRNKNRPY